MGSAGSSESAEFAGFLIGCAATVSRWAHLLELALQHGKVGGHLLAFLSGNYEGASTRPMRWPTKSTEMVTVEWSASMDSTVTSTMGRTARRYLAHPRSRRVDVDEFGG